MASVSPASRAWRRCPSRWPPGSGTACLQLVGDGRQRPFFCAVLTVAQLIERPPGRQPHFSRLIALSFSLGLLSSTISSSNMNGHGPVAYPAPVRSDPSVPAQFLQLDVIVAADAARQLVSLGSRMRTTSPLAKSPFTAVMPFGQQAGALPAWRPRPPIHLHLSVRRGPPDPALAPFQR